MKWTSKAARPHVEAMKQAVLSSDWGDIFEADFIVEEFPYKELRESNDDWNKHFSQKHVQQNLKNAIVAFRKDHRIAEKEAQELGAGRPRASGVGGGRGGAGGGVEEDEESFVMVDESPRIVKYPHNIVHHGDILSSNKYATIVIQIPEGVFYARVDSNSVIVEVVVDDTLYDANTFLHACPFFATLEGGAFVQGYAEEGRNYIVDEEDWAYPDRVRHECTIPIDFDIEQNFVSKGQIPALHEWRSTTGNRFLMATVVEQRANMHSINANVQNMGQAQAPPPRPQPQQPTFRPVANAGGQFFGQNPANFNGFQSPTPQHGNGNGNTNSGGIQQHQTPPSQYQVPHSQQFQSPQQSQPGVQFQVPQQANVHATQQQSPQLKHPPVQQQQQQQQPWSQQNPFRGPPSMPPPGKPAAMMPLYTEMSNINQPTPGVPVAASMPNNTNMSMNSSYTEETLTEQEQEAPKRQPAKKSFFKTVGSIMTGQSSSDDSRVSAHMKPPPKKYYGAASNVTVETVHSTSPSL